MSTQTEIRYFDALKRITRYQSVERLRKKSEQDWGLLFEEALEMAYENVLDDAKRAIKGKRRPAIAAVATKREADAGSSQTEGRSPDAATVSGQSS
jgi:hypothetical protein